MRQLTLRGFDNDLEHHIRATAEKLGVSLNKAVLHLLREGLEPPVEPKTIGHRLDHLFGSWTERDEEEFLEAVSGLDQVDPEMWS